MNLPLQNKKLSAPVLQVRKVEDFAHHELNELSEATRAAITDGGGFGWLTPPMPHDMDAFWQGVLLVPERTLLLATLDHIVAGAIQLYRLPKNQEARRGVVILTALFTAPWARGYGVGQSLVASALAEAKRQHAIIAECEVRETQRHALDIYYNLGFTAWGRNPYYAQVNGIWITGLFLHKKI